MKKRGSRRMSMDLHAMPDGSAGEDQHDSPPGPGVSPIWPATPGQSGGATSAGLAPKAPLRTPSLSSEEVREVQSNGATSGGKAESLLQELRAARENLSALTGKHQALKVRSEETQRQLAEREATVLTLQSEVHEKDKHRKELQRQVTTLHGEKHELKGQVARLIAEKDELRSKQHALEHQVDHLKRVTENLKTEHGEDEEVQKLRQELEALLAEKTKARRAAEIAKIALEQAKEQRNQSQAAAGKKIEELQAEIETLRKEAGSFPSGSSSKGAEELKDLEGGKRRKEGLEELLDQRYTLATQRIAELERQLAAGGGALGKRMAAEWRDQTKDLVTELAAAKEELTAARSQLEGDGATDKLSQLEAELAAASEEKDKALGRVAELSKDLETAREDLAKSEDELAKVGSQKVDSSNPSPNPTPSPNPNANPNPSEASGQGAPPKYLVQELQRKKDELARKDEQLAAARQELKVLRAKLEESGDGPNVVHAIFPWTLCMRSPEI